MSDYPDLSQWPVGRDVRPWSSSSQETREALARVDFVRDGFPLHEHVIRDRAADGSCTLTVPWSTFCYTASPAIDERDLKRGFNRAYLTHVAASPAEMKALREAVVAAGYLPLDELVQRNHPPS